MKDIHVTTKLIYIIIAISIACTIFVGGYYIGYNNYDSMVDTALENNSEELFGESTILDDITGTVTEVNNSKITVNAYVRSYNIFNPGNIVITRTLDLTDVNLTARSAILENGSKDNKTTIITIDDIEIGDTLYVRYDGNIMDYEEFTPTSVYLYSKGQ
ncbi:MAG: hypothetical protein ABIE68_00975 [bacterium]